MTFLRRWKAMLSERQVSELAKFSAKMVDSIIEFYQDEQNMKEYQNWHLKKYGRLPEEKVVV